MRLTKGIVLAATMLCGIVVARADGLPWATIEELVDQAELIVRGAEIEGDRFQVRQVLKGKPDGEIIAVRGLSSLHRTMAPWEVYGDPTLPAVVGRSDAVIFLQRRDGGGYDLVKSGAGVKRIHKGHVYAYYQPRNPGGYVLTLSYESDADGSVTNAWGNREPLTLELLNASIAICLRRARQFNAAAGLADETKRVAALTQYITTHRGHSAYYAKKALDALERIGNPAVPSILSVLRANACNPDRYEVVRHLAAFNHPQAISFLLNEIQDSTGHCRSIAVYVLGRLKAGEAVDPIIAIVKETTDVQLRETAIGALASIGDRRATPAIASCLASTEERVRHEAARGLAALADPGAFEPLVKALGDPLRQGDDRFRCLALDALYRADKARAVPICIEHLRSPEREVAHQAHTCLLWTFRSLPDTKDYASLKAWYDRLPKDATGKVVLPAEK